MESPTISDVASLNQVWISGLSVLVDLNDLVTGLISMGRVSDLRGRWEGSNYRYEAVVKLIPGLGITYIQTDDVYLHDLDYLGKYKMVDPLLGKCGVLWDANRLGLSWQTYLDNDYAGAKTAIMEFQVGDDISTFEVWMWENSAWLAVGDWGDADSWGATKSGIADDAVTHDFKADKGDRGEAVTGIGTVSKMFGLEQRVLMSVTLNAHAGTDLYTDYGTDQLWLKVKATHTQRDAKRPWPVVTYVDGSLDYGRA